MNTETQAFALSVSEPGAPAPVLTGVTASGRLNGVLFDLALRQTYRNASDRNLEVVYTFPLPCQAVLLAFASELNGERKEGVITAKREAERQYEEALLKGDAPVMLEALDEEGVVVVGVEGPEIQGSRDAGDAGAVLVFVANASEAAEIPRAHVRIILSESLVDEAREGRWRRRGGVLGQRGGGQEQEGGGGGGGQLATHGGAGWGGLHVHE